MQSDRIGRDLVKSMNWKQIKSKTQLVPTSVTWSQITPTEFPNQKVYQKNNANRACQQLHQSR